MSNLVFTQVVKPIYSKKKSEINRITSCNKIASLHDLICYREHLDRFFECYYIYNSLKVTKIYKQKS